MSPFTLDSRTLGTVARIVERLAGAFADVGGPMRAFGGYMERQTERAKQGGGRPEAKWPPYARSTRAARGGGGGKMLGSIPDSVRTVVNVNRTGNSVWSQRVDHPFARIHHRGATLPARVVRPTKAKALRIPIAPGRVVYAKSANVPAGKIPARPVVFWAAADIMRAKAQMLEHAQDSASGAVK